MSTNPRPRIAVLQPPPAFAEAAAQWAQRLDLMLVDAGSTAQYELLLRLQPDAAEPGYRLALQENSANAPGPVALNFIAGVVDHRRRFGGGRGQPLARAIGLKHGATPKVVDLTAGLGRDAFVLATLGCTVHMVERVPVVAALLENGLARAAQNLEVSPIIERMPLYWADSSQWLANLDANARPDVIYLDPMYPQRSKRALVKKEMQLFHALVGTDDDAPALLAQALEKARKRVVVKRPRTAPPLEGPAPQFVISSPNTRYDVYSIR